MEERTRAAFICGMLRSTAKASKSADLHSSLNARSVHFLASLLSPPRSLSPRPAPLPPAQRDFTRRATPAAAHFLALDSHAMCCAASAGFRSSRSSLSRTKESVKGGVSDSRREASYILLSHRANRFTHIDPMPSTTVNCFTLLLVLPMLGGFPLIVSAATTVTRADAFAVTDAYFAKLNGARVPLEAAVYSNPNGSDMQGLLVPTRTTSATRTAVKAFGHHPCARLHRSPCPSLCTRRAARTRARAVVFSLVHAPASHGPPRPTAPFIFCSVLVSTQRASSSPATARPP